MRTEQENLERYRRGYRRIHMDFHNPEFVHDIGHDLDARAYVRTLKDAAVNSLVVFAKCHHGNCYYPTDIGHQHPALNQDILGNILRECDVQDIDALIYYSVGFDTYISLEYPDWLCRTKDGAAIAYANWDFVCLNTPYKHEFVFPQLDELIERYRDLDVLGFWLDLCWMPPEGCYCDFCRRKFRREFGHDLVEAPDRERFAFLRRSVHDFIAESKRFVKARNPALLVSRNQVWLSHRPLYENADPDVIRVGEYDDLWYVPDFMVTETGLRDLYDASVSSRYFRGFGKPFEVLLTRFVHGWGSWDFVPLAHLITLSVQIAANGGVVSCGDQGYPNGPLDEGVYRLIGASMRYLREREDWFLDKQEAANICVLADEWDDSFHGLTHMLMQLQYPFAIRDYKRAQAQGLAAYDLIILPGLGTLNDTQRLLLDDYVAQGGCLLGCCSVAGLDTAMLKDVFGVTYAGLSPYSIGYLDMSAFAEVQPLLKSVLLVQFPFTELLPSTAAPLVPWAPPRVETTQRRYWRHPNSPPAGPSAYPAVTLNVHGQGRAMLLATPMFADYWNNKHWYLNAALETLMVQLGVRPIVKTRRPASSLEIAVTRDEASLQIHLLTFQEMPRTKHTGLISDNPAIYDVVLEVSAAVVSEDRCCTLQPQGTQLSMERVGDIVVIRLPKIEGYSILEIQ